MEVFANPLMIIPGTLLSEDLTFLSSLVLIQLDKLNPLLFIALYTFGVIIGDIGLYGIGYLFRKKNHWRAVKHLQAWFHKKSFHSKDEITSFDYFLLFTRFIPGSRIPTYISCGITGYSLKKFSALLLFATLIFSIIGALLVLLVDQYFPINESIVFKLAVGFLSFFITSFVFRSIYFVSNLKKTYGSVFPFLWIKLVRLRRFEFWPILLMYLPIVPTYLYWIFRYRGFKPLYSNPAIKMSGICEENKSEIDHLIQIHLPENRLETVRIDHPKEIDSQQLSYEIRQSTLKFPFIVKPDNGLRGADVFKVYDFQDLIKRVKTFSKPIICQELSSKPKEWGEFFYRFPNQALGKIYSVNSKEFPTVRGDGKSTMLDLVMQVPEFQIRFDFILSDWKKYLNEIPKDGEQIQLVYRGSHSKGSIFKDASHLLNKKISHSLTQRLSLIEGFNYGRVDIRFDNLSDLESGQFDLIEINGAGAESTNFYDPKFSLFKAYRYMFGQWSLAFKIGHQTAKSTRPSFKELPLFLYGLFFGAR